MAGLKVLIIGGGGREHAIAWKCANDAGVAQVYCAPGNAGTANETGVSNLDISVEDISGLVAFAQNNAIDLTIVGPEAPLVAGIVDRFQAANLPCFGPTQRAAILEGSKSFTKDFLKRHQIPTAAYATFEDLDGALAYIDDLNDPPVVKADGLAAGKGVVVALDHDMAKEAVRDMLGEGKFGSAGARVVIEERLIGEEASFIVMAEGEDAVPLASSQDHKARDEGDRGPNTGGMGAYSPAPVVNEEMVGRVMREVIMPTLKGMAAEDRRFSGFLYAGLMISPEGIPKVLEFNCRCGDPETQPILARLQSELSATCLAVMDGQAGSLQLQWDPRPALGVVMAAGGYPGSYASGDVIEGLEPASGDTHVFHAGTQLVDGQVVTSGGRVLCVVGLGDSVSDAQGRAYERVARIAWQNAYYREDIGYRAIARERD
ncbi:MAG: phosphoribosylamine--glycine ligase [Pseudomonadota bacterium]